MKKDMGKTASMERTIWDDMYYSGTITRKEWEEEMNKQYVNTPTSWTLRPDESHPVIDFKQEFEYKWTHTTGAWGTRKVRMDTRLAFLEQLNKWNVAGQGAWLYTTKGEV